MTNTTTRSLPPTRKQYYHNFVDLKEFISQDGRQRLAHTLEWNTVPSAPVTRARTLLARMVEAGDPVEPKRIRLTTIFKLAHTNQRMGYESLALLQRLNFIRTVEEGDSRTYFIGATPPAAAQPLGKRRGASTYGVAVVRAAGPNGERCPREFKGEEVEQVAELLAERPRALALYSHLRQENTLRYNALAESVGPYRTVGSALHVLEKLHLVAEIVGLSGLAVFGAASAFDPAWDDERAARECLDEARQKVLAAFRGKNEDVEKLLELYYALGNGFKRMIGAGPKDRAVAVALLQGRSYSELRPSLVFFSARPEYFLEIEDRVKRFGVTLLTYQKNLLRIIAGTREEQLMYGDKSNSHWKRELDAPELERFKDN